MAKPSISHATLPASAQFAATTSPSSDSPVSLTLPQVSVKYVRELLNTVGWANSLFNLKHGGDAFDNLPEPAIEPLDKGRWATEDELTDFRTRTKEWADKKLSFTLPPKQFKALKTCMEYYIVQKHNVENNKPYQSVLPGGRYTNAIIAAFNIEVPETESE